MGFISIVDAKDTKNEKEYLGRLQENIFNNYNNTSIQCLMNDIYNRKLSMSVNSELITVDKAVGFVDAIYKSLEVLLYIAQRPKSFIRTIESKEYIYKAKRISSKAMFYLGRDSSDWEDKKPLTVIPKKILADVNEETLDIYENRVYYDLIYVISQKISQSAKAFKEAKKQEEDIKISGAFGRKQYVNEKICPETQQTPVNINQYQEKIKKINATLKQIKKSDLFKQMSKVWHKIYTVHKTNNFIFDKKYKVVYTLWHLLNDKSQDKKIDTDLADVKLSLDPESCNKYYFNYILLSVLAILNTNISDSRISWSGDSLNKTISFVDNIIIIDGGINLKINGKTLTVTVGIDNNNGKQRPYIKIDCEKVVQESINRRENGRMVVVPRQTKNEEFYIYPEYNCLDDLFNNAEKYTKDLLNSDTHRKGNNQHVFYCLPITARDDDLDFIDDKTIKRLFGLGGMYDVDDTDDAENWRFFKRGILQITPRNYKDAFDSLLRLVNICVLFNDTVSDYVTQNNNRHCITCPVCGDKWNVSTENPDGYTCQKCKYMFTNNSLVNNEFIWIKPDYQEISNVYENIKYVTYGNADTEYTTVLTNLRRLYLCERIAAYATTSSFELNEIVNNNNNRYQPEIKTICPKCGKTAHENQNTCHRN